MDVKLQNIYFFKLQKVLNQWIRLHCGNHLFLEMLAMILLARWLVAPQVHCKVEREKYVFKKKKRERAPVCLALGYPRPREP